ncbi:unnamed protein product [Closterium sp. NIES-65]|nr:unnamed protein product [Closterium sp. NIES-65]
MPPKSRSTKAPVDVTLPDDLSTDPIVTPIPAGVSSGEQDTADAVNKPDDNASGHGPVSITTATAVAESSGLSVEEKCQTHQASSPAAVDFLEDDSDEELEIDIAKEDAFRLRFTAILLIPMVLSQEIKAIIAAVRLLMTKVWSSSLTENAGVTANIQDMAPGWVAKTRFCRLQISFLDERDAHHIKFHVFEYQKANAPAIKCIWQHTEDASYLREKASNPLAVEVLFRRVPANIVPDVLKDLLVRFKLKMRKQTAFKDGFAFHCVAHPLTGADTDVIKGLVVPHLGDPGSNREEWLCTQVCCEKARGKTLMAAVEHITSATHLLNLEKLGSATKASMDKANLASLKKEFGF